MISTTTDVDNSTNQSSGGDLVEGKTNSKRRESSPPNGAKTLQSSTNPRQGVTGSTSRRRPSLTTSSGLLQTPSTIQPISSSRSSSNRRGQLKFNFTECLRRNPASIPSSLLKDPRSPNTPIENKVFLNIPSPDALIGESSQSCLRIDRSKRQVRVVESSPSTRSSTSEANAPCRRSVSKVSHFDAIFTTDDSMTSINSAVLIDLLHQVVNGGTDACLISIGHATSTSSSKTAQPSEDELVTVPVTSGPTATPSELRAPSAEKAIFYLDSALTVSRLHRPPGQDETTIDHSSSSLFLFTLHVYQYRIERSGTGSGVSGGLSKLHLVAARHHSSSPFSDQAVAISNQLPLASTSIKDNNWSALAQSIIGLFDSRSCRKSTSTNGQGSLQSMISTPTGESNCLTNLVIEASHQPSCCREIIQLLQLSRKVRKLNRKAFMCVTKKGKPDSDQNSDLIESRIDADGSSCDESRADSFTKRRVRRMHRQRPRGRRCQRIAGGCDVDGFSSCSEMSCTTVIFTGRRAKHNTDRMGKTCEVIHECPGTETTALPTSPAGSSSCGACSGSGSGSGQSRSMLKTRKERRHHSSKASWPRSAARKAIETLSTQKEQWIDGPNVDLMNRVATIEKTDGSGEIVGDRSSKPLINDHDLNMAPNPYAQPILVEKRQLCQEMSKPIVISDPQEHGQYSTHDNLEDDKNESVIPSKHTSHDSGLNSRLTTSESLTSPSKLANVNSLTNSPVVSCYPPDHGVVSNWFTQPPNRKYADYLEHAANQFQNSGDKILHFNHTTNHIQSQLNQQSKIRDNSLSNKLSSNDSNQPAIQSPVKKSIQPPIHLSGANFSRIAEWIQSVTLETANLESHRAHRLATVACPRCHPSSKINPNPLPPSSLSAMMLHPGRLYSNESCRTTGRLFPTGEQTSCCNLLGQHRALRRTSLVNPNPKVIGLPNLDKASLLMHQSSHSSSDSPKKHQTRNPSLPIVGWVSNKPCNLPTPRRAFLSPEPRRRNRGELMNIGKSRNATLDSVRSGCRSRSVNNSPDSSESCERCKIDRMTVRMNGQLIKPTCPDNKVTATFDKTINSEQKVTKSKLSFLTSPLFGRRRNKRMKSKEKSNVPDYANTTVPRTCSNLERTPKSCPQTSIVYPRLHLHDTVLKPNSRSGCLHLSLKPTIRSRESQLPPIGDIKLPVKDTTSSGHGSECSSNYSSHGIGGMHEASMALQHSCHCCWITQQDGLFESTKELRQQQHQCQLPITVSSAVRRSRTCGGGGHTSSGYESILRDSETSSRTDSTSSSFNSAITEHEAPRTDQQSTTYSSIFQQSRETRELSTSLDRASTTSQSTETPSIMTTRFDSEPTKPAIGRVRSPRLEKERSSEESDSNNNQSTSSSSSASHRSRSAPPPCSEDTSETTTTTTTTTNTNTSSPISVRYVPVEERKSNLKHLDQSDHTALDSVRDSVDEQNAPSCHDDKIETMLRQLRYEKIYDLLAQQDLLKTELLLAKERLMVDPSTWSFDLHVAEQMTPDDNGFMEALEKETKILRKRVNACKSHMMLITSFASTQDGEDLN